MRRVRTGALGFVLLTLLAGPVWSQAPAEESRTDQPKTTKEKVASKRAVLKKAQQENEYHLAVQAELAVVSKTQGLLADKLAVREAEMKTRVRALYKLTRASFPRIWVEPKERRKVAQWLGAARRITTRDQGEIRLLHEEIDVANAAEARLKAVENHRPEHVIAAKSLRSPLARTQIVAAYGEYPGPSRRVRLRRRGVELKSRPGDEVRTPAPGRVLYVGPVSGLGHALLLEHEGFTSLMGHLYPGAWKIGDEVPEDALVAKAVSERVYLELRLNVGSVGQTVDPEPLLRK